MSIKGGPHIETDGLVLYYDVDNVDSYPGEPTTNLINYPDFQNDSTTGWVNNQSATLTATTHEGRKCMKVTSTTATSTPGTKKNPTISVSPNTTYRISQWGKNGPSGLMRWYIIGEVSGQLVWTSCGHNSSGWTRQTTTFTTGASDTYITLYYLWSGVAVGYYWYLTDVQLEVDKGHVTQFVNGTRSTTDGLKDLSGNANHADLANTTYDSSALIDYAGSGYATISDSSTLDIQGAMSIGAWINLSSLTTTPSDPAIYARYDGTGAGTRQFWFSYRNASSDKGIALYVVDSSNVLKGAYRTDWSPSTDTWYYVVGVFSPSAYMRIYINGVLDYETTSSIPADVYSTSIDSYIGGSPNYGSGYYFEGKIDLVQQYNRALTATEQLNNYNAVKSRFGH